MIARLAAIVLLALPLAGCFETIKGSIAGGECKVFERPEYVMLGKTQHDQDWIDGNVEAGVGGCGWQRPLPRPPEWDKAPAPRPAVAAKKQRVGILKRIKAKITRKPIVVTAPPEITTPPLPPPMVTVPPPEPVDPVDELLGTKR